MTDQTVIPITQSFELQRPLNVRAHSYLGLNDQGEAHTAAWTDVKRSVEKNQRHVAYDQIAHPHLHGQPCSAGCLIYLGLGTVTSEVPSGS